MSGLSLLLVGLHEEVQTEATTTHGPRVTAIDMILQRREHQLHDGDTPQEVYQEMVVSRPGEVIQELSTSLPMEEIVRDYIPEGHSPWEIADREREGKAPVSPPDMEGIPTMPSNLEGWG